MPSPHDKQRVRVFRRWLLSIDNDLAEAERITGVGARSLERMKAGTKPPPARLLDQLARDAATRGHDALAGELAGAAEAHHA